MQRPVRTIQAYRLAQPPFDAIALVGFAKSFRDHKGQARSQARQRLRLTGLTVLNLPVNGEPITRAARTASAYALDTQRALKACRPREKQSLVSGIHLTPPDRLL